jgi:hypothetical protein
MPMPMQILLPEIFVCRSRPCTKHTQLPSPPIFMRYERQRLIPYFDR